MISITIYLFILAIFFKSIDFTSVSNDTIIFAISLSTDIQVFRWIFKNS